MPDREAVNSTMYRAWFGVSFLESSCLTSGKKLLREPKVRISHITIYCEPKARFSLYSNAEIHCSLTKGGCKKVPIVIQHTQFL